MRILAPHKLLILFVTTMPITAQAEESPARQVLTSIQDQSRLAAFEADKVRALNVPLEELLQLAEGGNTFAQTALGNAYHLGTRGLERNEAKAVYWWKEAAYSGNNSDAEASLAEAYRYGNGVPRDEAKADHWLVISQRPNRACCLSYDPISPDGSYAIHR